MRTARHSVRSFEFPCPRSFLMGGDSSAQSNQPRGEALNPWTMKMEQFTAFSDMERRRLDELISSRRDQHAPKDDIIADGEHSNHCHVVLTGLACRYKLLPDGGRQIMAFLIPGDLCDAEIFILKAMDHGVAVITPTTTAIVLGRRHEKSLARNKQPW
jgi:CRP-like cAMP-binding protein